MRTVRRGMLIAFVVGGATALAAQDRKSLDAFLLCIECTFEMDSLQGLAIQHPIFARDSLIAALLGGPSAVRRTTMQAKLDSTYTRLVSSSGGGILAIPRPTFIAHYLSNFVASFQKRAAVALARVGQGDTIARVALDNAVADTTLRRDVQDRARFARDSIWQP